MAGLIFLSLVFNSGLSLAVHMELDEYDGIFGNGTKRADQPRKVLHNILLLGGVKEDLAMSERTSHREFGTAYPCTVSDVAHQGEKEEKQS